MYLFIAILLVAFHTGIAKFIQLRKQPMDSSHTATATSTSRPACYGVCSEFEDEVGMKHNKVFDRLPWISCEFTLFEVQIPHRRYQARTPGDQGISFLDRIFRKSKHSSGSLSF
jgi:hypothetical protein